jgi:outer membrane lipoprotein carrier protein
MTRRRTVLAASAAALALLASGAARADAVDTLRAFVRDVKSGRSAFTQTVVSPDGARRKVSSGTFEFQRPNRFRFVYEKPFEQQIVADGDKVWIWDKDLNQASSRRIAQALGATPAAILAGGSLDNDFALAAAPARDGLEWVEAKPKAPDSAFKSVRIGFRGQALTAIDIVDAFGQTSLLRFADLVSNAPVSADRFRFVPPAGADVIEQ